MEDGSGPGAPHGLDPTEARAGETVLRHWRAPEGRGLLTNLRCLVLGHPHPFRRTVLWSQDLEKVQALSVAQLGGLGSGGVLVQGSFGGGRISTGGVDPTFCVRVDEVPVFIGDPRECAELQRLIDDARASRCLALFGKVVPFEGPKMGAPRSPELDGPVDGPLREDGSFR